MRARCARAKNFWGAFGAVFLFPPKGLCIFLQKLQNPLMKIRVGVSPLFPPLYSRYINIYSKTYVYITNRRARAARARAKNFRAPSAPFSNNCENKVKTRWRQLNEALTWAKVSLAPGSWALSRTLVCKSWDLRTVQRSALCRVFLCKNLLVKFTCRNLQKVLARNCFSQIYNKF